MKESRLWRFMADELVRKKTVIFLCVLESTGSSPGRQGFKMAVSDDAIFGSIGGGIMEHKFVEVAREFIRQHKENVIVKKQVHSRNSSYRSGMICSGEQTIAVYPVTQELESILAIAEALEKNHNGVFTFTPKGFSFTCNATQDDVIKFEKFSQSSWTFSEKTGFKNYLYIVGGGHVSLAFSKLMQSLEFYTVVFDDRPELNTMHQNIFAHEKHLANYNEIETKIPEGKNIYVVIMTFGYRSDAVVLRRLIGRQYKYLGLLGSKAKIKKMLEELKEAGVSEDVIKELHAPIGIQIKSQTPEEIAVSIAAEIIQCKNKY